MKTKQDFRSIATFDGILPPYRLHIDHGESNVPPPSRPMNPQQCGPSYLWNGTHQRLIEIFPEDHPRYRENREMITETIRRWDRETSK